MQEWEERVFEVALKRREHLSQNVVRYIEAARDVRRFHCAKSERLQGEREIEAAKVQVLEEQAAEIARLKEEARVLDMTRVSCGLCGWAGVVRDLRTSKHGHCPKCGEHL